MKTLEDKKVKEEVIQIAKKYDLDLLILFGSRATSKYRKNSDFDFAFLKPKISVKQEMKLFEDLMKILQYEKIDLINISTNYDVKVRFEIFHKGRAIYEKKAGMFSILKGKAYIDYHDFDRFTKNREAILERSIKNMKI